MYKPVFFGLGFILLLAAGGLIVMLLWNAIMPDLLAVNRITYLQSIGLIALARILTGNFRSGRGYGRGRYGGPPAHIREKWKNMSAEEREVFRAQWKKRCAERKG